MNRSVALLGVIAALAVLSACGGKSPYEKILEERARWTVLALDWTQSQDNTVLLSSRLSGPPNSKLETLTVRIVLRNPEGETLPDHWHVFDLTEVPRGGPKDFTIPVAAGGPVDGLALDQVLRPGEDDLPNIPELLGVEPGAS